MKYYVVADVHGFFDELKFALTEKGFFTDTEQHKLRHSKKTNILLKQSEPTCSWAILTID